MCFGLVVVAFLGVAYGCSGDGFAVQGLRVQGEFDALCSASGGSRTDGLSTIIDLMRLAVRGPPAVCLPGYEAGVRQDIWDEFGAGDRHEVPAQCSRRAVLAGWVDGFIHRDVQVVHRVRVRLSGRRSECERGLCGPADASWKSGLMICS